MAWGESRADVGQPCPLALPGATPPHRGPGPGCVGDKHSGCGDMMRVQDLGPLDRTWVGLSAQLSGRGHPRGLNGASPRPGGRLGASRAFLCY